MTSARVRSNAFPAATSDFRAGGSSPRRQRRNAPLAIAWLAAGALFVGTVQLANAQDNPETRADAEGAPPAVSAEQAPDASSAESSESGNREAQPAAEPPAAAPQPTGDAAARARVADRVAAMLGDVDPDPSGLRIDRWRAGDSQGLPQVEPLRPSTQLGQRAWYDRLRVHGEIATGLRFRITEAGRNNAIVGYGIDRMEWVLRALIGLYADFDELRMGLALGTGSEARDAYAILDDTFAPSALFVRQAWGHLRLAEDAVGITLGRMPFPSARL
mgnify:CR=1 FL=1